MKLFAKAALCALALASAFAATVPADAAVVSRTTVIVQHNGCFNGNCMHRGYGRHAFVRRAIRHEMMRQAFHQQRHQAMRQAFLEHRYETIHRSY